MASKGRKIEGNALVVTTGSGCVGNMAWETPYIVIKLNGETFRYQSDLLNAHNIEKDDHVQIKAFARDNNNLYRAVLTSISKY